MTDKPTAGEAKRPSLRPGGPESLIGTVISGRYRIEKLLGEGGMGAVYRAEHTHMRKRLAIKVLHSEMSRLPEVVARFEREAMAAAHIEHPNVASATDFGKLEDGSFFLVLEYVEGHSLRDLIAKGPMEVGRALRILRQIAAGLQRAHALGIVHRDLKPENVMLIEKDGEPDFVKVLDFGIAKVPVGELGDSAGKPAGTALTQLGMVYGTPEYMAPEQALGQAVDPRADIYSLGVITFEMLAGVRPFEHTSKVTLLGMHVTAPVPTIAERAPGVSVPTEVESIIRRMLEKEADRRYADARALIDAIDGSWTGDWGAIPGPRASIAGGSPSLPGIAPTSLAQPAPGMPAAPATVTGKPMRAPPVERAMAAIRENPKPFAIGGVATVASLVLLGLLARSGTTHPKTPRNPDITTSADAEAPIPIEPAPPEVGKQIATALSAVERGDFGTGISQLKALEKEYRGRPEIHRALEKAYTATKNPKEALEQTKLLLAADPSAANDLKLLENVRNAAVRDAPDPAFDILEKHMGQNGLDVLYDIAYGTSGAQYPQAAERARKVLQRGDVKRSASEGLKIALDLRTAKGCEATKALFPRAKQFGDTRTVDILNPLTEPRPCGFANGKDCNACYRKDNVAQRTIEDIQKRIR